MKDLEKLGKRADKILREHNKKLILLKKACDAELIKEPEYKNHLSYFSNYTVAICPECKKELIKETYVTSPCSSPDDFLRCPNCEYEYAY